MSSGDGREGFFLFQRVLLLYSFLAEDHPVGVFPIRRNPIRRNYGLGLGLRVRVRVSVSANRVSANRD